MQCFELKVFSTFFKSKIHGNSDGRNEIPAYFQAKFAIIAKRTNFGHLWFTIFAGKAIKPDSRDITSFDSYDSSSIDCGFHFSIIYPNKYLLRSN